MNPFKSVRVPVASHGLHRCPVQVSSIGTAAFFENIPFYSRRFKKGEKINIGASLFSRAIIPLNQPAFVTGRFNIRGFYVPNTSVQKSWYDFDSGSVHVFGDGTSGYVTKGRYCSLSRLNQEFIGNTNLVISAGSGSNADITYLDASNVISYYTLTAQGAQVMKIFNALGISFSWFESDSTEVNVLKALAYCRLALDHYWPAQYVGNSAYNNIDSLLKEDTSSSIHVDEGNLIDAVAHVSLGYYDGSIFDSAFDNPVGPSVNVRNDYVLRDVTNNADYIQVITNNPSAVGSPNSAQYKPSNDTPFVGSTNTTGTGIPPGVLTQYVIDGLQALNNFLKRQQLSSRLIDRFLASRGIPLSKSQVDKSYMLGSFDIPLQVGDVENNSDTNLGELAGKALAKSDNINIKFNETVDDDGVFIVICSIIPDAENIVYTDPENLAVDQLEFHHSEFDKLGVEDVRSLILYNDANGQHNSVIHSQDFGFLPRYYGELADCPHVFGDFRVVNRGALTKWQYHSFRSLATYLAGNNYNLGHSYGYLRAANDSGQYERLFYSGKEDPFMILMRFYGDVYKEKLPLGDSYDWDDDEFNKKVDLITAGGHMQN